MGHPKNAVVDDVPAQTSEQSGQILLPIVARLQADEGRPGNAEHVEVGSDEDKSWFRANA